MPTPATAAARRPKASRPADTTPAATPSDTPLAIERVDSRFLESLIGYNARRAALAVIDVFLERMAVYDLRPVDFSALSLIRHNPGITSRQLCGALGILPPNLVGMIHRFEKRGLLIRRPHPLDGRAQGLHLTDPGQTLMAQAECTATELEKDVSQRLTERERKTLMTLLQKIYL